MTESKLTRQRTATTIERLYFVKVLTLPGSDELAREVGGLKISTITLKPNAAGNLELLLVLTGDEVPDDN